MKSRSKGISLSYIYTICNTIIGVFMSAYIIRMLGETEYGVYQTMTSFLTYLVLFEFGTGTIMTRNLSLSSKKADDEEVKRNYSTILSIAFFLSIVISIGIAVFYFNIGNIYSSTLTPDQIEYGKILFLIIAFRTIILFLIQTLNGALLGFEKYSFGQIVKLAYLLVRTVLVVILIAFIPYSLFLVIIDTGLAVIQLFVTVVYLKKTIKLNFNIKFFDIGILKSVLPLALAMFIQTVVNMANGDVDKFFIGVAISPEAVTLYSISLFIYTTFSSMTTIPISMYMPQIASDMKKGYKGDKLMLSLIQPCRLIAIIGGVILFGFISVGKEFINIVYGDTYTLAWIIAVILMIPMYINMCNGVLVNVLDVLRKRHIRSLILLITTIMNIVLTIWWIYNWQMIGAAIATAISTLIGQIVIMNIYYYYALKINVLKLFVKTYKGILPSLLIAFAISVFLNMFIENYYLSLIIGGLSLIIVFFICMFVFGANEEEKAIFTKIIRHKHGVKNE